MVTTEVREGDLVGTFGCPDGEGLFDGVLALGGSDGGIPDYLLRLLVPEGFACLALAYFNTPDTQPALVEVPLERIERGLRWMRAHPKVTARGDRIAVLGGSKGGELSLLAAATFPDLVGPVVAYTPSSVVWAGIDFSQPRGSTRSSWSLAGRTTSLRALPRGRRSVVERARPERAADLRPRSRECGRGRSGGHSDRTRNGSSACHLWR